MIRTIKNNCIIYPEESHTKNNPQKHPKNSQKSKAMYIISEKTPNTHQKTKNTIKKRYFL